MRTSLTLLWLAALLTVSSACSAGSDDVSAKAREQEVIDTITEAVPLAQEALGATEVSVVGQWSSCPGGIGHRFAGGGSLDASEGDPEAQLEAIRLALVGAGFDDQTQVDGYVSVVRDEVEFAVRQQLAAKTARTWTMAYHGPCKRYTGDDEDYVQAQNLEPARTLLP